MGWLRAASGWLVTATCAAALAAVMLLGGGPFAASSGLRGAGQAGRGGPPGKYHQPTGGEPFFKDAFCAECHPSPPHRRSLVNRDLLNHHAVHLHCLVCHGAGLPGSPSGLAWKDKVLWPATGEDITKTREREWRTGALTRGTCFSNGPSCRECHRAAGPLDFRGLGYDEATTGRLTRIPEFLDQSTSQKWFFPGIF